MDGKGDSAERVGAGGGTHDTYAYQYPSTNENYL